MTASTKLYTEELRAGRWPQVRARLRPLQEWERPPDADPAELRMVEFSRHRGGLVELAEIDWYSPSEHRELVGEFIHLFGGQAPASDEKVIDFYARYGPLQERGEATDLPAWALRLEATAQERLSTEARLLMCEPLWWLRERARDLGTTYELYRALKENRLSFLRSRIGAIPQGKKLLALSISDGRIIKTVTDDDGRKVGSFSVEQLPAEEMKESQGAWRQLDDDECISWANQLLADQLVIGENRSERRWSGLLFTAGPARRGGPYGDPPTAALRLVRARSSRDLLAAMYLQLGDLVNQRALMRQCEGCNRLFFPGRTDQRFCDPHCGDAARQRAYYAERKVKPASGKKAAAKRKPRGTRAR